MRGSKWKQSNQDNQRHKGRLSELFDGGKNNKGCLAISIYTVIFIISLKMCFGNSSTDTNDGETHQTEQTMGSGSRLATYDAPAPLSVDTNTVKSTREQESGTEKAAQNNTSKPTTISTAYQEGYDMGYGDGEEDAYAHGEWQESFDDTNRYRGKK